MSKKANTFRTPIGTRDLMPAESARWEAVTNIFSSIASRAGFSLVDTPIFEDIGVFSRIGEGTDVVGKEMYEFRDRSDRAMALRPEGVSMDYLCMSPLKRHAPLLTAFLLFGCVRTPVETPSASSGGLGVNASDCAPPLSKTKTKYVVHTVAKGETFASLNP